MADDPIGQAIGWVGTTMAIFLFLAPLPTMRKVSRARSTLEFSATPFLVSTLNCGLWSVYALPMITPDRYQSLVCNVFGLVMEVAYICHFLRFAAAGARCGCGWRAPPASPRCRHRDRARRRRRALPVLAARRLGMPARRSTPGWMASVFNILMYAAPLTIGRRAADALGAIHAAAAHARRPLLLECMARLRPLRDGPVHPDPNVSGVGLGVLQVCLYTYVQGSWASARSY